MYKVNYTDEAFKNLRKIDNDQQKLILAWIEKILSHVMNQEPLKGKYNSYWTYRVGDYRIIVDIIKVYIKNNITNNHIVICGFFI